MRVGLKLTTCALVLSLGLAATDSWAAPGEPSPSAVKTVRRQTPPLVSAAGLKSHRLDKAGLSKQRLQETTTGTKDPRTGQDLSKNANPGSWLPGGKDLGKEFPSAEKQWNERMKGALGGGLNDLSDGTPFDDKPGSNPADDFLKQHGGNIPDPLAGSGSGRSGFSPASDGPGQWLRNFGLTNPFGPGNNAEESGSGSVTVGEIIFDAGIVDCASDHITEADSGNLGITSSAINYDGDDVSRPKGSDKGGTISGKSGCPKGAMASSTRAKADIPAGAATVPMT